MIPGVVAYRNNTGARGRVRYGLGEGGPDIVACVEGQFLALEGKRPGEKLRPAQIEWAERFRMAGGMYFPFYSATEAYKIACRVLRDAA